MANPNDWRDASSDRKLLSECMDVEYLKRLHRENPGDEMRIANVRTGETMTVTFDAAGEPILPQGA